MRETSSVTTRDSVFSARQLVRARQVVYPPRGNWFAGGRYPARSFASPMLRVNGNWLWSRTDWPVAV
jgi:hypothetical protein